ncbi:MAG: hypothetical protein IPK33_13020 [Gemmatimonadetes bacterium]|nr:hypothetical protein [Gemmatimonadota bacterium]
MRWDAYVVHRGRVSGQVRYSRRDFHGAGAVAALGVAAWRPGMLESAQSGAGVWELYIGTYTTNTLSQDLSDGGRAGDRRLSRGHARGRDA